MGALALFLVLTGGVAYGANTVFSSDIVNGEVKTEDIGASEVTVSDIGPDAVRTAKVLNGSLTGGDIADGMITGADVNEGSLGQVPNAALGGIGRSFAGGNCNPESTTFIDCGFVTLNLPSQARIMVVGMVRPFTTGGTISAAANCRLVTNFGVLGGSTVEARSADVLPLTGMTGPMGPGPVDVGVECNEQVGVIAYKNIGINAVAISPN
jgi:hypothetical protein